MTTNMNDTEYEGVTIHIPPGTVLTASKGNFIFPSSMTGIFYACKKVEYRGNGNWLLIGGKTEVNCTKISKEEKEP